MVHFVNHFHSRKVVDAWVDSAFVQEDQVFHFGGLVESEHLGRYVGGSDHVFADV